MRIEKRNEFSFYHADCMQVMRETPDKYYDLALVDPPYGIGMSNSNKRTKPSRPNSYTSIYKDFRYHEANWDNERPTKDYFNQLFRISKNQIIWGANYLCEFLPSGKGWIFWNKLNGLDNCFSDGEFAFSSKGVQSKYFECSVFHNLSGGKDRIHPTEKPTILYDWILKNYSKTNDKILDTHGGSMSIALAVDKANKLDNMNLSLTVIELDEEYFNAALQRFDNGQLQQTLNF